MPRRLPVRPQVIIGNIFVVLVSWVIGIIYYAYVFLVWLPKAEGKFMKSMPYLMHIIPSIACKLTRFYCDDRQLEDRGSPISVPHHFLHAGLVIHSEYDNRSRSSTSVLGIPSGRPREQATPLLPHV